MQPTSLESPSGLNNLAAAECRPPHPFPMNLRGEGLLSPNPSPPEEERGVKQRSSRQVHGLKARVRSGDSLPIGWGEGETGGRAVTGLINVQ